MMTAHSKKIIEHLDDAIQFCVNTVEIQGVLSELNVNIVEQGENIVVKYKGVVDVNNAFIKFYGAVYNSSTMFNSIVKTLKSSRAEVVTISNNGEIIDTIFNNHVSVVYIKGKLLSEDSIRADYINILSQTTKFYQSTHVPHITLIGIVDDFNRKEQWVDVFVLNSYYHQMVRVYMNSETKWDGVGHGNMVGCVFDSCKYIDEYPPIQCVSLTKMNVEIDSSIIDQARNEHKIYQKTMKEMYGKTWEK